MSKVWATVAIFIAGAIVLSGCVPTGDEANPSPHASQRESSTPTPRATRPALAELVIGPEGLGPLVIGEPVRDEPEAVAVVRWVDDYCRPTIEARGDTYVSGKPFDGAWVAAYDGQSPFTIGTSDGMRTGPVGGIEVSDWDLTHPSQIATATGVHAGDPVGVLTSAYSQFAQVIRSTVSDVYVVAGAKDGFLTFEVSNHSPSAVAYWPTNGTDRVLSIRSGAAPSGPIAGTDAGGNCAI